MEKPKRRAMTPARKLKIHTGQNGICGCGCGEPVDLSGPNVRYDHTIDFWTRPDLDDDGPNVKAVITAHDALKTYGRDIPRIAKTKRQAKMRLDVPRPEPTMKAGRGLQGGGKLPGRGKGRKLNSRPLQSRNSFRR